jgi:hypothetical protein
MGSSYFASKKMEVSIRKCEVYQEVEKITSIIGSQTTTDSGSLYKQIWASPSDAPTLDTFWRDAASGVYDLFRRYLSSSSVEYNFHESDRDEIFILEADDPIGFEDKLTNDIINNIKSFFVMTVTSGWFGLKLPNRAEEYANEAALYGTSIKEKLLFKKDPEQARVDDESEEDGIKIIRRNDENKCCNS